MSNRSTREERLKRTLSLVIQGRDVPEIAAQLSVAEATVYNYLRALGLGKGKWKAGVARSNPMLDKTREMYESGLSLRDIARQEGVSAQAIHSRLRRTNCALRPRSWSTGIDIDKACAMYEEGASWKAVATHFKVAPKTLRKHLKAAGIESSRRRKRVSLPDQDILDAYNSGASIYTLAQTHDVHWLTIKRRLIRLGATLPKAANPSESLEESK
ncbi:MAG: hypothetical protein ACXAEN_16905 [Candidatus Thorarchaeota archaeon]|jgi:transposase